MNPRLLSGPRCTTTLTPREFAILAKLKSQPGAVIAWDDITPLPKWGDPDKARACFRKMLLSLRDKFDQVGLGRSKIQTVRFVGVRFVEEPERGLGAEGLARLCDIPFVMAYRVLDGLQRGGFVIGGGG